MAGSLITKQALANSLKEIMEEKPLSKITVKDIVEKCDMNRKSFYYHFKDKYDLVNWIYYTEFITNIQEFDIESEFSMIEKTCDFLYKNKSFYRNALQIRGQNSFYDYFGEVLSPIIAMEFEDIFEDGDNKEFYINFITDAIRTSITRWMLEGAELPPKDFANLIKNAATGVALKVKKDLDAGEK